MNTSVKSLKKQLAAAIAMTCVAAIALGSSTFAWFVSNNSVEATTTNISAQSNSAYLVIDNAAAGQTKTTSTSAATASETFSPDTKLYPAQWANHFDASKGTGDPKVYQFETAYASVKGNAAEKDNTRFAVGDPAAAAAADYTLANTFYIGTGTYDGIFEDLKVTGLTVNNTSSSDLNTAVRVLVTCDDQWVVAKAKATLGKDAYVLTADLGTAADDDEVGYLATNPTTKIKKSDYNALGDKTVIVSGQWEIESQSGSDGIIRAEKFGKGQTVVDALVKVYVYYDGSDGRVFTTNLENLKDIGVTVTFEATSTEYGKA